MRLLASGKWSKVERGWKMVVALGVPAERSGRSVRPTAERTENGTARVVRLTEWRMR